jgi:NodT family efflux transporter outer membrane factor (OMF) lipoprotein
MLGAVSLLCACSAFVKREEPATFSAPVLPETFESANNAEADAAITPWWATFNDVRLTQIVTQTLAQNLSWQAADARVAQARALAAQADAAQAVTLDAGASYLRQRRSLELVPDGSVGSPSAVAPRQFNTWRLDTQLRWQWDAFGELKLEQAAADQRVLASQASQAATRLVVASEAAGLVIQARAFNQRLLVQRQLLVLDNQLLDIASAKQRAGITTDVPRRLAESAVQTTQAQLVQLQSQLADLHSALAVLAAITPAQAALLLGESSQLPDAPDQIAVGLPSQLLLRRPDLLEAQAQLRAASADLASNLAQRYPKFTLNAQLGWAAASAAALGSTSALFAALSPTVSLPILDGGATKARIELRRAQQDEAVALYRQAVMRAFAQTQTALQVLALRRTESAALAASQQALNQSAEVQRIQADKGHAEQSVALQAQRTVLTAQVLQTISQQQNLQAAIELYQAAGGGWTTKDYAVFEPKKLLNR